MPRKAKNKKAKWARVKIRVREDMGFTLISALRLMVETEEGVTHQDRLNAVGLLLAFEARADSLHHHALAMLDEMHNDPVVGQYVSMVHRNYYGNGVRPNDPDQIGPNPRKAKLL